ncbi:hypothetical protein ACRRTK_017244 [Alexandromys fortis]
MFAKNEAGKQVQGEHRPSPRTSGRGLRQGVTTCCVITRWEEGWSPPGSREGRGRAGGAWPRGVAGLRGVAAAEEPVGGGRQRVCAVPSTLGARRVLGRGSARGERADGRADGRTDGLGGEVAAEPAPERRHTAGAGKPQGTAAPPGLRHGARRAGERASVRAPPPRPPRLPRVPSVVARTCASQSVPPSAVAAHLGAARAGRRLRDAGGAGRARAP